MPFEIAPQEVEITTEVGRYKHLAAAMLRGASITPLAIGVRCDMRSGGTCALGAMHLGLGCPLEELNEQHLTDEEFEMHRAYRERYGAYLHNESNERMYTREQIAERIAAL